MPEVEHDRCTDCEIGDHEDCQGRSSSGFYMDDEGDDCFCTCPACDYAAGSVQTEGVTVMAATTESNIVQSTGNASVDKLIELIIDGKMDKFAPQILSAMMTRGNVGGDIYLGRLSDIDAATMVGARQQGAPITSVAPSIPAAAASVGRKVRGGKVGVAPAAAPKVDTLHVAVGSALYEIKRTDVVGRVVGGDTIVGLGAKSVKTKDSNGAVGWLKHSRLLEVLVECAGCARSCRLNDVLDAEHAGVNASCYCGIPFSVTSRRIA